MENNIELNEKQNLNFFGSVEIPPELTREFNKCMETYNGARPYTPKHANNMGLFFENEVITEDMMFPMEKDVFEKTEEILALMGGKPKNIDSIKIISVQKDQNIELLRDSFGWIDLENRTIYIYRPHLSLMSSYAGALLYECTIAKLNCVAPTTIRSDALFSKISGNIALNAFAMMDKIEKEYKQKSFRNQREAEKYKQEAEEYRRESEKYQQEAEKNKKEIEKYKPMILFPCYNIS